MVKYKLVFCDFDDTLAVSGREVGEYTRRMIAAYRAAGGTFVICSGRSRKSLEHRLASVYGDATGIPYICLQGGVIVDGDGRELRRLYADKRDVIRASDAAYKAGCDVVFHADGDVFAREKTDISENYARLTGCPITYLPYADIAREYDGEFEKMMILSSTASRAALEDIARMRLAGSRFMFSGETYLELVPAQSGKGSAVKFMTEKLGLTKDDTAAFGDADNDVDMLGAVGLPVAVRNAMPGCVAAAKLIAPSAADEGPAHVLDMFIYPDQR